MVPTLGYAAVPPPCLRYGYRPAYRVPPRYRQGDYYGYGAAPGYAAPVPVYSQPYRNYGSYSNAPAQMTYGDAATAPQPILPGGVPVPDFEAP